MVLLFGALLLRAMIPAGWMPGQGSGFRIELCVEWGGAEASTRTAEAQRVFAAAIGGARGHDRSDDRKAGDQPCAFAGLGLAWAPADSPVLDAPAPVPTPQPLAPRGEARVGEGLAAPPPPATGPPLHA